MEGIFSLYPLVTFMLSFCWLAVFYFAPSLRREMIVLGVFAVFLMPFVFALNQLDSPELTERFLQIQFVDLLFSFVLAGLAGTLYHVLFGKHYHKLPRIERKKFTEGSLTQLWLMRLFITFLLLIWGVIFLHLLFGVRLPLAFLLASITLSVYMLSHRHDLLSDALWSSFLTAFTVYLSASLVSIFTETNFSVAPISSDAAVFGVPLDLLLWSAAAGLALGPLYEYIRTLELK